MVRFIADYCLSPAAAADAHTIDARHAMPFFIYFASIAAPIIIFIVAIDYYRQFFFRVILFR